MSRALASFEPCGCTRWISVLGHGSESDADAYRGAAREARRGLRVETVRTEEWKAAGLHCADHPEGPPWWKSNGGNGRRPAEYAEQRGRA